MSAVSVYIIEERALVRNALVQRLSQSEKLTVLGHGGEVKVSLDQIAHRQPDAVLVEIKRSDGMGLEVLSRLSALRERPQIIVLTSYPASWEEQKATDAGADAYIMKDIEAEELIDLICQTVHQPAETKRRRRTGAG